MKRFAYVTTIRDGREADLREAQTNMPADDLQSLGIHSLETFIGSGYYVLVFEVGELDFQTTMQRFFNLPRVQGYLDKLRPHVEGFPARGEAYAAGDDKHVSGRAAERGAAAATVTSAELPLAASAYYWSAGTTTTTTGLDPNGGSAGGGSRLPER